MIATNSENFTTRFGGSVATPLDERLDATVALLATIAEIDASDAVGASVIQALATAAAMPN
jgi:hypothetical protein